MTRHVVGADVGGSVVEYVELISTRPCDCPKRASSIARLSPEGSELSAVSVLASNMGV